MTHVPEFEIEHSGVLNNNNFWDLTVEYAKNDPTDTSIRITVENCSENEATITLLPQLYYRNDWSWVPESTGYTKPVMRVGADGSAPAGAAAVRCDGTRGLQDPMTLLCHDVESVDKQILFCDNETNMLRFEGKSICRALYKTPNTSEYPKDCINNAIVRRDPSLCNPDKVGSKMAVTREVTVPGGEKRYVYFRLLPTEKSNEIVAAGKGNEVLEVFDGGIFDQRRKDHDEFYEWLNPSQLNADRKNISNQAFAGMIWTKQVRLVLSIKRTPDGQM
jgi:hypothetical protein